MVALGIGVVEKAAAVEPLSPYTSEVFTPDGNIREFIKILTCDKDSANAGTACTMDSQCTGGLCGDSQTYFVVDPALEGPPQDPDFGAIKANALISRGVFLRRDNSPEPGAANDAKQSGFRDRPAASGVIGIPTGFNIGRVFASYNPNAYGGEGAYFLAMDISAPAVMDSLQGTQPIAFDVDGDGDRNTQTELALAGTVSEVPSRASFPDGYGFEIDIDGDEIGEVGILIAERAISIQPGGVAIDPPIVPCTVDTDCTGAITCNTNTGFCAGQVIDGTIVRRYVIFNDGTGCLPGTQAQQALIFLDANDDGLIDYRDFGVGDDVEIVVRNPGLLPQPPDPLFGCAVPPQTNDTPACIGFVFVADTFDDEPLGGGGEDRVDLIASFPVPDIEVSKEVKCVDDPEDAYANKVSAVPGSTVEYRVTITNWGNRDLDVTLTDLFDCDAPASGSLVDGSCQPAGAFCTAFENAFQSGAEFLVDVGTLPAADQCAVGPAEPFVFSFQVLTGSVCGEGCSNQVTVNATTTQLIDPILAPDQPSADSPDGNSEEEDVDDDGIGDVADEFFIDVEDVYKAIDTSREATASADDNTAGLNFQCRDVTFTKQVRVLPDGAFTSCEDAAVIANASPSPIDVEYKFIVVNSGDVVEEVTIRDPDLCADIAGTAGASFVDCPLCPSGQIVGNAPAGGSFMTSCVVRFDNSASSCSFVDTDNNRPECQADNDSICTPDGDGCHRNCATASAQPVAAGICDGAIDLDACSILCVRAECELDVVKTVRCIDGCGTKNPLGAAGDTLVADPGSWAEFEVAVENTGGVPMYQVCITDTLSCGWDVCGLTADIGGDDVSANLAGFAPDGVRRCFVLSSRPLGPGEILSIRFNVQVPASFPILGAASDCRNDVTVDGYKSETDDPTEPPAETCTDPDSADIDVRVPRYSCGKTVSVDLGDDGSVEIGATSFANITTATFPMRLTYSLSVSNTGEVDIADARICDDRLVADAIAAGIAVEACALCDGACDGVGDTCTDIGLLVAGTSATRTCELVVPDLGAWNLFASSDLIDSSEVCYTNEAEGDGTVEQSCVPPGTPNTIVTDGCQAAVCISTIPECPVTKAKFDIWNENEVRFSGTHRCIYSWDQTLLSRYTVGDIANHLTRARIHTNKGKARIDGMSSPVVCGDESIKAPLLGVATKIINFAGGDVGKAGRPLLGAGTEVGVIKYDLPGDPSGLTPSLGGPADESKRATISEKGSLLVYAKVEIKWDSNFNLIQDTFLSITNDFTDDALVQLYMVNGDQPVDPVLVGDPPDVVERGHLGCNSLDNVIILTGDQPTYWSALDGGPAGVSPFTVLDPGFPPGRPDTDPRNPGGRVLRGYVLAWAVNGFSEEVQWNHLAGNAVIVNYRDGTSWEYETWNFKALAGLVEGDLLTVPLGQLGLDGVEYAFPPSQLMLDFHTFGATWGSGTSLDTDLTLWAAIKDLRAP